MAFPSGSGITRVRRSGPICARANRQLVFTIPKRLRFYCRYDRRLPGGLARAAWRATVEGYRQQLKRGDLIPSMVAGIQTFGELVHFHPHIHAIVTDGGFTLGGSFICLPRINTSLIFLAKSGFSNIICKHR